MISTPSFPPQIAFWNEIVDQNPDWAKPIVISFSSSRPTKEESSPEKKKKKRNSSVRSSTVRLSTSKKPEAPKLLWAAPSEDSYRFLPSPGILAFGTSGRHVQHDAKDTRQCVLSADWVHCKHNKRVRSWHLVVSKTSYLYGDVYFGITEATAPTSPGRTIGFDFHGNFRLGDWPSAHDMLADGDGSTIAPNDSLIVVTADLEKQSMSVEFRDRQTNARFGRIDNGLDRWHHARLWVSSASSGTELKLVDAPRE
tara:strand:+ start:125 stop:886 length:762 start_codon:yes stop_codon:yes gene_type:complete